MTLQIVFSKHVSWNSLRKTHHRSRCSRELGVGKLQAFTETSAVQPTAGRLPGRERWERSDHIGYHSIYCNLSRSCLQQNLFVYPGKVDNLQVTLLGH